MESRVFSTAMGVGIAGLVCKNACSTDHVVVRAVIVTVDPEMRLMLLDHGTKIRNEMLVKANCPDVWAEPIADAAHDA